uniref:Ctr_137_N conopeptide n=1 Tax=Conus tribblei TaxID=101761 RepID=A0A0C9RYM1_CONTD
MAMNMWMTLSVLVVVVFTTTVVCSTSLDEDKREALQLRWDTASLCCLSIYGCYWECKTKGGDNCWLWCAQENYDVCNGMYGDYCWPFANCFKECIKTKSKEHCFNGCTYEAKLKCIEEGYVACCPKFMTCYNECLENTGQYSCSNQCEGVGC